MTTIDPNQIRDDHAKRSLVLALDYQRQIHALAASLPDQLRVKLDTTLADIQRWVEQIAMLAKTIDLAESNPTLVRDKAELPRRIEQLKAQEKRERNAQKKLKLTEAIATQEQLLVVLRDIEARIHETHTRLDVTVGQLGEVYQSIESLHRRTMEHLSTNTPDITSGSEKDEVAD